MRLDKFKAYLFLFFFYIFIQFFSISISYAIMPSPDIGINYETMEVDNPRILKINGMDDVVEGDKIVILYFQDGKIEIKNERTGETVSIIQD